MSGHVRRAEYLEALRELDALRQEVQSRACVCSELNIPKVHWKKRIMRLHASSQGYVGKPGRLQTLGSVASDSSGAASER